MSLEATTEQGLPGLMTTQEVADYLGLPVKTVRTGRLNGHPLFRKGFLIGGRASGLRYYVKDVLEYVQSMDNQAEK